MNVQTDVSVRSKNPSIVFKHKLFPCFCTLREEYLNRNTFLTLLSATQVLWLDNEICSRNNNYSLLEQIVVNLVPRLSVDFLPCKGA